MTDRMLGKRAFDETQLPENEVQQAAARCLDPIFPSIQDLHTIPDRSLIVPSAELPDHRGPAWTGAFAKKCRAGDVDTQGYSPFNVPALMGDRLDPYTGSSVPDAMHPRPEYPSGVIYQSDLEQASSQSSLPSKHSLDTVEDSGVNSKNKRRRVNFSKPATDILRAWFHGHLDHPYLSEEDKQMFATHTGLNVSQVSSPCPIRDHIR